MMGYIFKFEHLVSTHYAMEMIIALLSSVSLKDITIVCEHLEKILAWQ